MSVLESFRLDGKRACVTGGSRGLGFAMARGLAEAGADLVLVGRDLASLEQARDDLVATGRQVEILSVDVGSPEPSEAGAHRVLETWGPIDILVNNVGGRRIDVPTETLATVDWQRIIDLNLTSAFVWSKVVGGSMLPRGWGRVINVASISGLVANRGIGGRSYETSKAALLSFTRALAADWAPRGVTVNAIAPGGFLTEPNQRWFQERPELRETFEQMIPMGRFGVPDELAPLAVYLASDASRYMTGATLVIDGGYTLW
ncbi:gluconate 5-dehydrogenase [Singulisphaera sp. GP187]|uniref:SDR family NAD(P)-dependent oxidoreductase n=1 Tax=Singulisphaera sp. GP187 TaxID=1882752 RepID=UPI0009260E67|nr:SDR family oxidoreductase [Singulisphaera sp. GP187]SIO66370.1 gluconate 5-dehydrogenase [Singulisphaera sp. GP187]